VQKPDRNHEKRVSGIKVSKDNKKATLFARQCSKGASPQLRNQESSVRVNAGAVAELLLDRGGKVLSRPGKKIFFKHKIFIRHPGPEFHKSPEACSGYGDVLPWYHERTVTRTKYGEDGKDNAFR